MDRIEKSGFFLPNHVVLLALNALEDVTGRNAVKAVLNLVGLSGLIDHYPPATLDKEFDFADFSTIFGGLTDLYGPRGSHALSVRAGKQIFMEGLGEFDCIEGLASFNPERLNQMQRMVAGINLVADFFNAVSDQVTVVTDRGDDLIFSLHRCPVCWGRQLPQTECFIYRGLLLEATRWYSGGGIYSVVETECAAKGDRLCEFTISKTPVE
jgi:predicted hydrocarbon binding protein